MLNKDGCWGLSVLGIKNTCSCAGTITAGCTNASMLHQISQVYFFFRGVIHS